MLTQGCDAGDPEQLELRSHKGKGKGKDQDNGSGDSKYTPWGSNATEVQVERAWIEQTIIGDAQGCSLPSDFQNVAAVGDQVRVFRNQENFGLYTVHEHLVADNPNTMRLSLDGRLRLDISEPFKALFSTTVTVDLSDAEAEARGELVERLIDDGFNSGLAVVAPHGGDIEVHTDHQAEYISQVLPGCSAWICKGWNQDGSSFNRWHIDSTELSPNSFTGLGAIAKRGFAYTVAFHGMSMGGVLLGGAAPYELKQLLRDAIELAINDSSISVDIATAADLFNGDSAENCVNWRSADGFGGVQIEQSYEARVLHWQAIAHAVADVFSKLV